MSLNMLSTYYIRLSVVLPVDLYILYFNVKQLLQIFKRKLVSKTREIKKNSRYLPFADIDFTYSG